MFSGEVGNVQAHFPNELITEIHDIAQQKKILKVALYDYNPPEQSPNNDYQLELSFLTGDILHICKLFFIRGQNQFRPTADALFSKRRVE